MMNNYIQNEKRNKILTRTLDEDIFYHSQNLSHSSGQRGS